MTYSDYAFLEDPNFSNLLLLTGHDYEDYKKMYNFVKESNPIMDKSIYSKKLYDTFVKNADVVDLQGEKFAE